jgi:hypothetical protein
MVVTALLAGVTAAIHKMVSAETAPRALWLTAALAADGCARHQHHAAAGRRARP